MTVSVKPHVAIAGAGIGGLALASALIADGADVKVYEQASAFTRVGAGIQMTPNAMKVLRGLGLEEKLRAIAFEPISGLNREHASGALTNELLLAGRIEQRYGAPFLLMHRADLHAALAEMLPPGIIGFGKKLTNVRQGNGTVLLEFAGGSRDEADVLIGADGVHSRVRELMLGTEQPRYTGKVAYRTTFPAKLIAGVTLEPYRTKWWGPDRHIVIYYVTRQRDEIYFVTSQPESAQWMTTESWSAKGDVGELRQAFADFHPEVRAVLDACPDVHRWALLERDPLPTWVDRHVALLGDACHPMTPYMAQGAASALEDAAVLARCLSGATAATINESLKRYEAIRKPRASKIQSVSGANTWMRQPTDPSWVYGYDAWTAPLASRNTMSRVTLPGAAELSPEQRRVYDAIGALRRGHVPVHYHAALCNPELADKWQQIGELLRYRTSLPLRLSELAILVTACDQRCDYQWTAHAPIAAKAGLAPDIITAIKAGRRPDFTMADDAAVYDYCTMLLQTKFVDGDTHARAIAALGGCGIVELTALLGYYVMVAMSINAHELSAAPDAAKP